MHRIDKGVLNSVKKTFSKIGFGTTDSQQQPDPLISMNIPPSMARRDSAYDRAAVLLREHIFSLPEKQRSEVYISVLKLLEIAIEATKTISISTSTKNNVNHDPILQYLLILSDTVNAASALVRHELALFKDEKSLISFLGNEFTNQFISAEEIFSNSEMNIFHSINDLLDIAEPAILNNREYQKRSFTKNELKRYNKAHAEFKLLYENFGKITPE